MARLCLAVAAALVAVWFNSPALFVSGVWLIPAVAAHPRIVNSAEWTWGCAVAVGVGGYGAAMWFVSWLGTAPVSNPLAPLAGAVVIGTWLWAWRPQRRIDRLRGGTLVVGTAIAGAYGLVFSPSWVDAGVALGGSAFLILVAVRLGSEAVDRWRVSAKQHACRVPGQQEARDASDPQKGDIGLSGDPRREPIDRFLSTTSQIRAQEPHDGGGCEHDEAVGSEQERSSR